VTLEKRVVGRTDQRNFLDGGFWLAHNHYRAATSEEYIRAGLRRLFLRAL
jgi:hypothetical protein